MVFWWLWINWTKKKCLFICFNLLKWRTNFYCETLPIFSMIIPMMFQVTPEGPYLLQYFYQLIDPFVIYWFFFSLLLIFNIYWFFVMHWVLIFIDFFDIYWFFLYLSFYWFFPQRMTRTYLDLKKMINTSGVWLMLIMTKS